MNSKQPMDQILSVVYTIKEDKVKLEEMVWDELSF